MLTRRLPSVDLAKEGGCDTLDTMHYVYLLSSQRDPRKHYVGFTHDLKARLARHNAGQNVSTAPYRPWNLAAYFAFPSEPKAREFEKYLKSGSGKTFAKRHFF